MTEGFYSITDEPKGEVYKDLIKGSLKYCDRFQLVIRSTINMEDTCRRALERLQPFLTKKTQQSEWPGTQLLSGTADVYYFHLTPESAVILTETAEGLYSWQQPELPEDLCLITPKGNPWLITISHEKDGYLKLSEVDKKSLTTLVPGLTLVKDHSYQ